MDTALLKHLGVDARILMALEKSWGSQLEEVEIEQGDSGLRLILRARQESGFKTQIITLNAQQEKQSLGTAESEAYYNAVRQSGCRCRDTIDFFPAAEPGEANVRLNGQRFRMSDSLFRLLHCLGLEMKRSKPGWISIQDLRAARVIPSEGYQIFSRLRSVVAGYLLEKNPREFLEANGVKQYRLSVPPGNIRFFKEGKEEDFSSGSFRGLTDQERMAAPSAREG